MLPFIAPPKYLISDFLDVGMEAGVEGVAGEGGGVAEDDEFHAGARDSHVHASEVAQEADFAVVVGAHEADEYHVALLPLESIYGIDRNQVSVGFEKLGGSHHFTQKLHLRAVGRNDAHVDALVEHVLAPDFGEILL